MHSKPPYFSVLVTIERSVLTVLKLKIKKFRGWVTGSFSRLFSGHSVGHSVGGSVDRKVGLLFCHSGGQRPKGLRGGFPFIFYDGREHHRCNKVVDVVVPTSSWLIHDFSVSVCDANAYRRYSSWKIRQ